LCVGPFINARGYSYVLTRNPERARKDAETHTALLAGLERKLTQGDKAVETGRQCSPSSTYVSPC
jgi:hypothetical protein